MKKLKILVIMLVMASCTSQNYGFSWFHKKLKIAEIDSVDIYYIYNIDNKKQSIIIGEKEHLRNCSSFKKYIIIDSIKTSLYLKEGKREVFIGANEFHINDKKIKNAGEPVKYIDNCRAFR